MYMAGKQVKLVVASSNHEYLELRKQAKLCWCLDLHVCEHNSQEFIVLFGGLLRLQ